MSKTVTGTRRPWWRSYDGFWSAAIELGSPAAVLWSVWWFVGMARGCGHDFDDDHIGPTVVGSIFFFFVFVFGVVMVGMLRRTMRSFVLISPCPVCGADGQRDFFEDKRDAEPTPCGTCLAYLRANGLEISEERLEAFQEIVTPYRVTHAQLGEQTEFAWPPMCSVCGAADAPHHREIEDADLARYAQPGVLGTIAGDVVSNAAGIPYSARVRAKHSSLQKTPAEEAAAALHDRLAKITTPVCDKHTAKAAYWSRPLEVSDADLSFGSYRYYKAFCEQNQIRPKRG